jgi:chromosomal replication initiator protein
MLDYVTELPLPGRVLAPPGATPRVTDARERLPAFVAGPENRLVAGAIGELVESASLDGERIATRQFVPSVLVLFGASGTGKSHLAYGVVRHWQTQLGDESARYTTAADFRHLLNDAVRRQAEVAFREEFRGRQLLAIDDLQHLPAGDFAWQELRYTLDDYDDRGGTVIVTANEAIPQLANVPADIRGRLAAGLALELAPPGDEARLRILRHAATALRQPLSDEAAERLARGLDGTANGLFQALFELFAPAQGRPANDALRAERLLAARAARRPSLREIVAVVARQQGVPQAQLKSGSRQQSIVMARGIIVFLARELANISYDEIGRALGGRDHTTIIHSYRKIDGLRKRDVQTQQTLEQLQRILLSR